MHRLNTSFILGYHGCSADVAEDLFEGKPFKPSQNEYDWLGPGIYFWQSNPRRALEFAQEKAKRQKASWKPQFVGAAIDLGLCLDLSTKAGVDRIWRAYDGLVETARKAEIVMPVNSGGSNLLLRKLDCAVVRMFHSVRETEGEPPIDTIAGIFIEGSPIYANSGFHQKTHTQICVCNPSMIKGVFRVPASQY